MLSCVFVIALMHVHANTQFTEWAKETGFARCEKVELVGGASAAIAHKAA